MRSTPTWVPYRSSLLPWLIVSLTGVPGTGWADVVRDGTLGEDVPFETAPGASSFDTQIFIDEVHGERAGENLFHSFADFDVESHQIAVFRAELPTANVIGRVTSGLRTTIAGDVVSEIPGANLFLLNPQGFLFGRGSSIRIDGSFHASTADFLEFGMDENQRFFADPGRASVLSPVDVTAFGFLGDTPAPIELQWNRIEVGIGSDISLIGGDITGASAFLQAGGGFGSSEAADRLPASSIRLFALGSSGRVSIDPPRSAEARLDGFERLGTIDLRATRFDIGRGDFQSSELLFPSMNRSGFESREERVAIQAQAERDLAAAVEDLRLEVEQVRSSGSLVSRGEAVGGGEPSGGSTPGAIELQADDIRLSTARLETDSGVTGRGSDIRLLARDAIELRSSMLIPLARRRGRAGDLVLRAGRVAEVVDSELGTASIAFPRTVIDEFFDLGTAGAIRIHAPDVELDQTDVFLGGSGLDGPGTFEVVAPGAVSAIGLSVFTRGNEDGLIIGAGRVRFTTGDFLALDSEIELGDVFRVIDAPPLLAGGIEVRASQSIGIERSVLSTASLFSSTNDGIGAIRLRAPRIRIEDSQIDAQVIGDGDPLGAAASVTTPAFDAPPRIEITARDEVEISSSSVLAGSRRALRNAGQVRIEAPVVNVVDSSISSDTEGPGRGGEVLIDAADELRLQGARVSSTSSARAEAETSLARDLAINVFTGEFDASLEQRFDGLSEAELDALGLELFALLGELAAAEIERLEEAAPFEAQEIGEEFAQGLQEARLPGVVAEFAESSGGTSGSAAGRPALSSILLFPELLGATSPLDAPSDGPTDPMQIEALRAQITGAIDRAAQSPGDAGVVGLASGSIRIDSGSAVQTDTNSLGNAGNVAIRSGMATEITASSVTSRTSGAGNAGSVSIDAASIRVAEDALVATGTSSTGQAGDISVVGRETVEISASEVSSSSTGAGDAGSISVSGSVIAIESGGTVQTDSLASGAGGDISLAARDEVSVSGEGSSVSATTAGSGAGGSIAVTAAEVRVSQGGEIRAASRGTADAGSVDVEADRVTLDRGVIRTDAAQASGGEIRIRARDRLALLGGSRIDTNVNASNGDGGNVRIDADTTLIEAGTISANAVGGDGGRVEIRTRFLLANANATQISASSREGRAGVVSTTAPDIGPSRSLIPLDTRFRSAADLLRPACDVRGGTTAGSLIVDARRGLPLSPDQVLLAFDGAGPNASDLNPSSESAGDRALGGGDASAVIRPASTAKSLAFAAIAGASSFDAVLSEARHLEDLGDFARANEALERALWIARENQEPGQMAAVLGRLGNIYVALGELGEAGALLGEAVEMAKRAGDRGRVSTILNNLGNQLVLDGREREALGVYAEAQSLALATGSMRHVAQATANAARAAAAVSDLDRARDLGAVAERALVGLAASHDRLYAEIHLAGTYERLAQSSGGAAKRDLLAAHGLLKRAGLAAEPLGDARAAAYAWGALGRLYASESRHEEALALSRRALDWAEDSEAENTAYLWHAQVGRSLRALGRTEESIQAYRRAVEILQDTRPESALRYAARATSFSDGQGRVYRELVDLLLQSADRAAPEQLQALLREARHRLEQLKAAELRDYFRDECVAQLEARTIPIDVTGGTAAVIYPVLLPDRVELLVSLGGELERFTPATPATRDAVIERARELWAVLSSRRAQAAAGLSASRQLYDWLVAPYAKRLDEAGIETLVFVPGESLRSVPFAALHDGDDYLVRRFSVALAPSLSLTDPRPLDRQSPRLLLAGLSEAVGGRPALPSVPKELAAIREIYGGETLLDPDFTSERVMERVNEKPFSMIHLASHAEFSGDPATSFVATYDGEMSIQAFGTLVQQTRFRDSPLELLVLSACDTALGDDRAALGLAGVALEAGARSAVGSLFRVTDDASLELMRAFYTALSDPKVSRAEALRRAQLSLLDSEAFAHPRDWAPYLLIGNWL